MKKKTISAVLASIMLLSSTTTTYATTMPNGNQNMRAKSSEMAQPSANGSENASIKQEDSIKVDNISDFSKSTIESGGTSTVKVTGKNLKPDSIKVMAFLDGVIVSNVDFKVGGTSEEQTLSFKFPENDTEEMQKYFLNITVGEKSKTKRISVKPKEKDKNIEISSISCSYSMSNTGENEYLINPLTVEGNNLKPELMKVKVLKKVNEKDIDQPNIYSSAQFTGDEKSQKAFLKFPKNITKEDEEYIVKVGFINEDDGSIKFIKEKTVVIKKTKISSSQISKELKCNIYMDKTEKVISAVFNQNIENGRDDLEQLKRQIRLSRNHLAGTSYNTFNKLGEKDRVDIKANKLIITLDKKLEGVNNVLSINDGTVKDNDGLYNDDIQLFIKSYKQFLAPKLIKIESISDEILTSEGGEVAIKIEGENLKPSTEKDGTVAQIFDTTSTTAKKDIKVDVTGEGNSQTLKFKLPANTSDVTKTYIVRISIDGGATAIDVEFDYDKRLVIAVLPKNKTKKDTTLSHVTINSYGTNIENPWDNTSTKTPINQESKKTRLRVYGTNLVKNKTKVRITDENGVEWPVLNDPSKDSYYYFIMVNFDGTGIIGNGNYQMLEVICPNNMRGDVTFKMQIAVDGINFNEDIVVHATVLQQENGNVERNVRTVKARYVDENGNEIEKTEEFKAYDWFNREYVTVQKDIQGYNFKEIAKGSAATKGIVKENDKVVTYVYSRKEGKDNKEVKDNKDNKDEIKDNKNNKDNGEQKGNKDKENHKDSKVIKDNKQNKETIALVNEDNKNITKKSINVLPKTGEEPTKNLFIGSLMILMGFYFTIKRSIKGN